MRVVGEAEVACELNPVVGVKSLELVLDEISVKAMLDVEIPVVGSEGVVSKLSEKKKTTSHFYLFSRRVNLRERTRSFYCDFIVYLFYQRKRETFSWTLPQQVTEIDESFLSLRLHESRYFQNHTLFYTSRGVASL